MSYIALLENVNNGYIIFHLMNNSTDNDVIVGNASYNAGETITCDVQKVMKLYVI